MKKIILALMLLCASPCFAQLVLPSGTGVVQAPVDANGWLSYKLILTQNVTSFAFIVIPNGTPPPSQAIRTVEFVEDATGGRTIAFASSILNPCTISTGANAITICQFIFDSVLNTWSGLTTGGVPGNSPLPASSSGPGPVFNVKNYGAVANSVSSQNCTSSGTNLNCTDVTFTVANVGQRVSCASTGFVTLIPATATFTAFVNSTNMTMSASGNAAATCVWGIPDDAALASALAAASAFCVSLKDQGNLKQISSAPTLYFPAGAYNFFNVGINIAPSSPCSGFTILGDGIDITKLYWNTGSSNAQNAAIVVTGTQTFFRIENVTVDGANGASGYSNALNLVGANSIVNNVKVQRFQSNGFGLGGSMFMYNPQSVANGGIGIFCSACNGEIRSLLVSNNTLQGIKIVNSNGEPGGQGIKIVGGLVDENGAADSVQIQDPTDVWLIGPSIFSGSTKPNDSCLHLDSTFGGTYVHFNGGICGVFGSDTNETGVVIDAGSVLEASDVRMVGTGTGNCIKNSGTLVNNGANSCESMFSTITAASSSGTTATLTVTTQTANVSTVCSVGDTIQVQNVGVTGYDGYFRNAVTAVGTNTISYTTPGSNLGASSGGSMFCKGFVTYSGNLPYSTITPTPNTCYVTGTFAAITLCNQFIDRAVNIYRIKASSGVTTACTVAPVVTITDGTNSATLTITTAKASWDSSIDASTNVGNTVYTPHGGTLTVSTTAGTCTTPPTNFALTYTMQAVLDN